MHGGDLSVRLSSSGCGAGNLGGKQLVTTKGLLFAGYYYYEFSAKDAKYSGCSKFTWLIINLKFRKLTTFCRISLSRFIDVNSSSPRVKHQLVLECLCSCAVLQHSYTDPYYRYRPTGAVAAPYYLSSSNLICINVTMQPKAAEYIKQGNIKWETNCFVVGQFTYEERM